MEKTIAVYEVYEMVHKFLNFGERNVAQKLLQVLEELAYKTYRAVTEGTKVPEQKVAVEELAEILREAGYTIVDRFERYSCECCKPGFWVVEARKGEQHLKLPHEFSNSVYCMREPVDVSAIFDELIPNVRRS